MIRPFVKTLCYGMMIAAILQCQATPATCHMEKITTLPLHETHYTLSIPASLNGEIFSFMVDTGSEGSLLTPETMVRFQLRPDDHHHTIITGSDGHPQLVPNIHVDHLKLGSIHFNHLTFPLGEIPALPYASPPLLGIIGMNILGRYDLDIDLSHHHLTLWNVQSHSLLCQHPPMWQRLWLNLSATRHRGRFIIPFVLDNKPGTALIDSGAHSNLISTTFVHQIGITDSQLSHDHGGESFGIEGHAQHYYWHRFHTLKIGTEQWIAPTLTVAPLKEQADMLLGIEWFQTHHIWLSAATEHVFVQGASLP